MNVQMTDRRKLVLTVAASFICGFVACGLCWMWLPLANGQIFRDATIEYTVEDGLGGVSTTSDLEVESAVLGSDYLIIRRVGGRVEVIPIERVVRFSCQPTGPR
ncbi:MAG TPA: hypothetical protein DDX19_01985 [Rhodopirellula baltica]|uniref:Uncharacterized protein n=2 Tax=Rhodopirellula baltica TaxID=265606 RepID=Q7UIL9_RHOBA|nr:hypothetical protein-signal peptide and transmembrane prediction [Rhodopirellula baltica SH 1]HBE61550.1 hypothetical protein [Rhodopirellula baltica]